MPQMMPLNWFMLFIFFSSLLMIINITNYYTNINKLPVKSTFKTLMNSMSWKW